MSIAIVIWVVGILALNVWISHIERLHIRWIMEAASDYWEYTDQTRWSDTVLGRSRYDLRSVLAAHGFCNRNYDETRGIMQGWSAGALEGYWAGRRLHS